MRLEVSLSRDSTPQGARNPVVQSPGLLGDGRWLMNPGSVGQPRDGDPRAAYLLLDLDASSARYRRVPYDVEATQAEIRDAGLPEALAERLAGGE